MDPVAHRGDASGRLRPLFSTCNMAVVVCVLVSAILPVAEACSPPVNWKPTTKVEKLLDSSQALYATVRQVIPDATFNYGGPGSTTVYTAVVDVHCIVKGEQTDSRVNITRAGTVAGMCHSTNLTVGHRYIILVRKESDESGVLYTPISGELNADTDEQVANLTIACNLQQLYPRGVDASSATIKCPALTPEDKCKSKEDFDNKPDRLPTFENTDDEYYGDDKESVHVARSQDDPSNESRQLSYTGVVAFITASVGCIACWLAWV